MAISRSSGERGAVAQAVAAGTARRMVDLLGRFGLMEEKREEEDFLVEEGESMPTVIDVEEEAISCVRRRPVRDGGSELLCEKT